MHSANSSPARPTRARSGTPQSPYPYSDRAPSAARFEPAAHPSARNRRSVAAQFPAASAPPWRHRENVPRATYLPTARSIPPRARTSKIPPDKFPPPLAETIHPPSPRSAFPRPLPAAADIATNPHSPQIVWDSGKSKRTPASIPASPSPPARWSVAPAAPPAPALSSRQLSEWSPSALSARRCAAFPVKVHQVRQHWPCAQLPQECCYLPSMVSPMIHNMLHRLPKRVAVYAKFQRLVFHHPVQIILRQGADKSKQSPLELRPPFAQTCHILKFRRVRQGSRRPPLKALQPHPFPSVNMRRGVPQGTETRS